MPEKPISETRRPDLAALWRHRALVVAALYGFVALVGALYYALLLGNFGLNPFHYWEATDFLLATLREPFSIVFGLIAVSVYFPMIRGRELNDLLFGGIPWVRRLTLYDRWRSKTSAGFAAQQTVGSWRDATQRCRIWTPNSLSGFAEASWRARDRRCTFRGPERPSPEHHPCHR